jgi:tetratricopeptide (TPR) repeat protein
MALAPVSGIVGLGSMFAADRYSYLPTAILACGISPLLSSDAASHRISRRTLIVVLLLVCIVEVPLLFRQQDYWSSNVALWQRAYELYPQALEPRWNLADALAIEFERAEAERGKGAGRELLMRSLELHPANDRAIAHAVDTLALAGHTGEACVILKNALASPEIRPLVRVSVLVRLAQLSPVGERPEYERQALDALQPEHAMPSGTNELLYLGYWAEGLSSNQMAEQYYSRAVDAEPANVEAIAGLARARMRAGKKAEAIQLFQYALKLNPNDKASIQGLQQLGQ